VKLELSGSGGGGGGGSSHPLSRHQPAHSASAAASPGSEQGGGGKDPANPDDPLAAIMNQTIFGGKPFNLGTTVSNYRHNFSKFRLYWCVIEFIDWR
jgi:hypothetical protein